MTKPAILKGDALHALFERAWALLNMDAEDGPGISEAERKAAVAEFLQQQPLAPATMPELRDLHDLWIVLGEPETVNAVLHQHRDAVLSAPDADISAPLLWELLELASRKHLGDLEHGEERLAVVMEQLHRDERLEVYEELEYLWEDVAAQYQAWHLIEAHIDWQHQRPQSEVPEALRDVLPHQQKAELARERGDQDAVEQHISLAIAHLGKAAHDKLLELDENWWQYFSNIVLALAPRQIPALIEVARARLDAITPPVSTPIRIHWEAHFARWQAHALAELEQWEDAIEHARRGHHLLEGEPYNADEFGAHMLGWLVKAGHLDEAAEHAWRGLWCAPWNGMAGEAYQLALKMRDEDATRPHWDWILAAAQWRRGLLTARASGEGLLQHLNQPPPLPARAYLERARQIAPDQPVPDLIEGVHLAQQQQWQAALPLLEGSVLALPAYADVITVCLLWNARCKCLPEDEALNRPFPECGGAVWDYAIGCDLIEEESDGLTDITETCGFTSHSWPQRYALGMRYWETARARFEAYFASGEGGYADADIGSYSSVCHVIGYQYKQQYRIDDAIPVLQTGIALGRPTWKHYSNLMECLQAKEDYPAVLALTEQFWHDLSESSNQSGYIFANCAHFIAYALHMQVRHHEISIWIDRLNTWWEQLNASDDDDDDDDAPACRGDYLSALMALLQIYSIECPTLADPILRTHLPEILALTPDSAGALSLAIIWRDTGNTLSNCGHYAQAIHVYQQALAHAQSEDNSVVIDELHTNIADCQRGLGEPPPTRKFWQFWK